jgi:nicotinamide-nucleotide amidase
MATVNAEIVAIGSELLLGQIVDTNSAWMAQQLAELGESSVDDRIGPLIRNSSNPTVGVLAHPGQVDVRISVKTDSLDKAYALIAPVEEEVRDIFTHHVFAVDHETMEDAVGKWLKAKGVGIAVIEDLTGGMIAQRL